MKDGIGIDVGLKSFAVCSNGDVFENINHSKKIKKLEKRLKRQQRKLSRKFENTKKGGETCFKNIQKQVKVLQKSHARLANIRKEYVRDVVNRVVKTKPSYISIEDLNVKGMLKNKHLADSVRKQNFYTFRTWLGLKCKQKGIEFRLVNRFYPSSKLCSTCGHKKIRLSLSERMYKCESCGNELNRDFNASLNLRNTINYTVVTTR